MLHPIIALDQVIDEYRNFRKYRQIVADSQVKGFPIMIAYLLGVVQDHHLLFVLPTSDHQARPLECRLL